jgi:hypothetical protein
MFKFGAAAAAMAVAPRARAAKAQAGGASFASVKESLRFTMPSFKGKCRFMVVGDSHLSLDDARGEPFRQYSNRMSKPYRSAIHFRTGRPIASPEGFEYALAEARKLKVDLLALVGDIVSFPSEAGVEYVRRMLDESGLNWMYVAGNHDWHYEGLPGTEMALRAEWTRKRLAPLYQGKDPMMASRVVKGIRFVFIDNSLYEILPEQLDFWRRESAKGEPVALMMHIPLYMPGYGPREAGCAHPEWGAKVDDIWQVERRPQWPAAGHTQTTFAFREAVFSAPNLLGVFVGHVHRHFFAFDRGRVQCAVASNSDGSFFDVRVNC